MPWQDSDIAAMRLALEEADAAAAEGEIPVGAVIAVAGDILARGHNRSIADRDPSAHAEIVALRSACAQQQNYRLREATLYVTLEPCPMCIGALAQARVDRIVFGAYDPKAGAAGSAFELADSPVLNHRFEINGGLLANECQDRLKRFFASRR